MFQLLRTYTGDRETPTKEDEMDQQQIEDAYGSAIAAAVADARENREEDSR